VVKYESRKKKEEKRFNHYMEKRTVQYYAPFTAGAPDGWGWKIDTAAAYQLPVAGNFSGLTTEAAPWNADTSFVHGFTAWATGYYEFNVVDDNKGRSAFYFDFNYANYPFAFGKNNYRINYDYYDENVRYQKLNPAQFGSIYKLMRHPTTAQMEPRIGLSSYKKYLADFCC